MKMERRKSSLKKTENQKTISKDQKATLDCALQLRKIGDLLNFVLGDMRAKKILITEPKVK